VQRRGAPRRARKEVDRVIASGKVRAKRYVERSTRRRALCAARVMFVAPMFGAFSRRYMSRLRRTQRQQYEVRSRARVARQCRARQKARVRRREKMCMRCGECRYAQHDGAQMRVRRAVAREEGASC